MSWKRLIHWIICFFRPFFLTYSRLHTTRFIFSHAKNGTRFFHLHKLAARQYFIRITCWTLCSISFKYACIHLTLKAKHCFQLSAYIMMCFKFAPSIIFLLLFPAFWRIFGESLFNIVVFSFRNLHANFSIMADFRNEWLQHC